MTKAELIAALDAVPDEAEIRVFVDEYLYEREHNDQLDINYVDTGYAVGSRVRPPGFVILHLKEDEDA